MTGAVAGGLVTEVAGASGPAPPDRLVRGCADPSHGLRTAPSRRSDEDQLQGPPGRPGSAALVRADGRSEIEVSDTGIDLRGPAGTFPTDAPGVRASDKPYVREEAVVDGQSAPALSRRRLVQALVVAAGAAGATAAGRAPAAADDSGELVLTGRHFRTARLGAEPGRLPGAEHLPATSGELVLDSGTGRFASTVVPGSGGRFALHSFDLGDGTLLGMGSGDLVEGAFAVVGGTGRYAGARGSYTARQSPRDLGGDGTATFVFALSRQEA